MNAILYPGSFDPITLGHINVISRLREHFDRVVVLVADSPRKNYFFSQVERKNLILEALKEFSAANRTEHRLGQVDVEISNRLTVEFAKNEGIRLIARSVRTVADWEYEYAMADANKKLSPEIETFFIMASSEHGFVSSSLVREVAQFGGDTRAFVPRCVAQALKKKVKDKKG